MSEAKKSQLFAWIIKYRVPLVIVLLQTIVLLIQTPIYGGDDPIRLNAMFDIAINLAVGGTWTGHPDDDFAYSRYLGKCFNKWPTYSQPCTDTSGVLRAQFPATYEVDYVRVYTPSASPVANNADLSSDTKVNIQDLSILISKWATNTQPADINKDGIVNIQDLSILISKWTG